MHRALGGAPISRVLPLSLRRRRLRLAPALVGWLLANSMRVRLCLRLALGGGSASRKRPIQ